MIERLQPVFARPTAKNGRFHVSDNFLRSWLAALATPAASVSFRPVDALVAEANDRLADAEGQGLERLVGALYQERSQKGLGDFALTERIQGFWDRQGTEIDLVALNGHEKLVRLGSCKRNPEKLIADLPAFDRHVARFLAAMPRFAGWGVEKVAMAPRLTPELRTRAKELGFIPQDLFDLTRGL